MLRSFLEITFLLFIGVITFLFYFEILSESFKSKFTEELEKKKRDNKTIVLFDYLVIFIKIIFEFFFQGFKFILRLFGLLILMLAPFCIFDIFGKATCNFGSSFWNILGFIGYYFVIFEIGKLLINKNDKN
jgi:hypothetical protein